MATQCSARIPKLRHRNWGHRVLGAMKMPASCTMNRSPRMRSPMKMQQLSVPSTQVSLGLPRLRSMPLAPRLRSCLCLLLPLPHAAKPTIATRMAICLGALHEHSRSCDLNSLCTSRAGSERRYGSHPQLNPQTTLFDPVLSASSEDALATPTSLHPSCYPTHSCLSMVEGGL